MPTYKKLVRDRIPEIIQAEGRTVIVKTLTGEDLLTALKAKLVEEAEEVVSAKPEKVLEELADAQEIIDVLTEKAGYSRTELLAVQKDKREQRGGFERGFFLESVE